MLDYRCERFLLALVPCPAAVDELETVGRHPAGGAALLLEALLTLRSAVASRSHCATAPSTLTTRRPARGAGVQGLGG